MIIIRVFSKCTKFIEPIDLLGDIFTLLFPRINHPLNVCLI